MNEIFPDEALVDAVVRVAVIVDGVPGFISLEQLTTLLNG